MTQRSKDQCSGWKIPWRGSDRLINPPDSEPCRKIATAIINGWPCCNDHKRQVAIWRPREETKQ